MRSLTRPLAKRRGLSDSDRAAWASYAQLVSPLPGVVAPVLPPRPAVPAAAPLDPQPRAIQSPLAQSASLRPQPPRPAPLVVGASPGGIDSATWHRFRENRLPATRTLDLHGRTAQRAYTALEHFLHRAVSDGARCVEVITGRGSGETGGVIRREFPLWLNQPHLRRLILAAAHPHALNPGSVRLLLRRSRPPPNASRETTRRE